MDFQPGEVVQVREDSRFQFFDMAKKMEAMHWIGTVIESSPPYLLIEFWRGARFLLFPHEVWHLKG